MSNKNDIFEDLEDAFGLPSGSTKMNATSIRKIETAISKKTNEIGEKVEKLESLDIVNDGNLDVIEQINRGREYLRVEAINTYSMTKDTLILLKSELMPGASASLWAAYASLIKSVNECHSKIEQIYTKLEDRVMLHGDGSDTNDDNTVKPDTVVTDVDTLMDMVNKTRSHKNEVKNLDAEDVEIE